MLTCTKVIFEILVLLRTLLNRGRVSLATQKEPRTIDRCGRRCVPRSFVSRAKDCNSKSKDVKDFLDRLTKIWHHLQTEGEDVFVVYEKCYCPLVKDYDQKLLPSFCNCSRGWIKELFESTLGKPVDVKLQKSIRRGDNIRKNKVSRNEWNAFA